MSDLHDESARLLAALREPEPPGALRARALAGARAAWERPADRWLALWESRPMRIAWAAAVVLLAAANIGVRVAPHAGPRARMASPTQADAANDDLQAITALPRLRPEYADVLSAGPAAAAPKRNPRLEGKS